MEDYNKMIISNSLGRNKIENFPVQSNSNVFIRSDGFHKIIKGFSSNKAKAQEEVINNNFRASSGLKRYAKQYRLHAQHNQDFMEINNPMRTMTATKDFHKRSAMFLSGMQNQSNEKKAAQFLKLEKEEEICFRNFCKTLCIS